LGRRWRWALTRSSPTTSPPPLSSSPARYNDGRASSFGISRF
jgi:hypothetical protein